MSDLFIGVGYKDSVSEWRLRHSLARFWSHHWVLPVHENAQAEYTPSTSHVL